MQKVYLISNNQKRIVNDMFFVELNNKTIKLQKATIKNNQQQYYLIQTKPNEEVSWWISYTGVPRVYLDVAL